jgi:hypothetical protein
MPWKHGLEQSRVFVSALVMPALKRTFFASGSALLEANRYAHKAHPNGS